MSAEGIRLGVHALDRVLLPETARAKGWSARLAEAVPDLAPGSVPVDLVLRETVEGVALAETVRLGGRSWPEGVRVQVEPVPGRAGIFLVRLDGKAAALAAEGGPGGIGTAAQPGPERPEALRAFAATTLIDTPEGARPADSLAAGDVVTTLGNGSRPLVWVGRRRVSLAELLARPGLRPVEFAPGAIGNDRTLVVSAEQRMLIDDWRAEVYFGEDRVLVAAQALVDDRAARLVLPADGIDYVVLLCDRHEVLLAEGALTESFHPGENGLAGLDAAQRAGLAAAVPEAELIRRRVAFPIVRGAEARALRLQG